MGKDLNSVSINTRSPNFFTLIMGNHFYDLKLSFPYSKSFLFLWVSALFLMSMKYAIHFGRETAIKTKIVKLNKNILLILDQTKFLNPTLSFLH